MLRAKPKTLIAGALIAAIAIVVGCGDGKSRPTPVRRSSMPNGSGKAGLGNQPGGGGTQQQGRGTTPTGQQPGDQQGGGTPGQQQGQTPGKGQPNGKGVTPTKDPNEGEIQKQEEALKAGVPVTKDQMPAGTYRIESSVTSMFVSVNNVFARAIQSNKTKEQGGGFTIESVSQLASGVLPSFSENGRSFDLPFQFEVNSQNGKWATANVVPASLKSFATTETGKLNITDRLNSPAGGAELLNILNTGSLKDRTYNSQTEDQKKIEVTLLKMDDQTLRVYVSVEERLSANVDKNGSESVTFYRNFFITYKITPTSAGK